MKAATLHHKTDINADIFQSTPPVKAATLLLRLLLLPFKISIHAAREGGDAAWTAKSAEIRISIHAAREGGDALQYRPCQSLPDFNPRRP